MNMLMSSTFSVGKPMGSLSTFCCYNQRMYECNRLLYLLSPAVSMVIKDTHSDEIKYLIVALQKVAKDIAKVRSSAPVININIPPDRRIRCK